MIACVIRPNEQITMAPIEGFWGKPTSTLDWCEENYAQTYYIAEFWNTLSNLAMIFPAITGFYYAYRNNLERHIMLCFISLWLVGFGSWNFHMTLLYEMQLFDELPMIWGSLMLMYVMLTHLFEEVFKQNSVNDLLMKMSLILYGVVCTTIYLCLKTPILFQVAYGILVTLTVIFDTKIIREKKCDTRIFYASILFYYGGFFLWLIDNFYCQSLRTIRSSQVLPFALNPFTQLHAWWHFMAGYGAYLHILFVAHSRLVSNGKRFAIRFVWHTGIVLDHLPQPLSSTSGQSTNKSKVN